MTDKIVWKMNCRQLYLNEYDMGYTGVSKLL